MTEVEGKAVLYIEVSSEAGKDKDTERALDFIIESIRKRDGLDRNTDVDDSRIEDGNYTAYITLYPQDDVVDCDIRDYSTSSGTAAGYTHELDYSDAEDEIKKLRDSLNSFLDSLSGLPGCDIESCFDYDIESEPEAKDVYPPDELAWAASYY